MFPKVVSCMSRKNLNVLLVRNLGSTSVLYNKAVDPIQQLFVDKVRDFYKKKSAAKGVLVDSTPEAQKALNEEIEKLSKTYGSSATSEFPTFTFAEPKLDSIYTEKLEKVNH